MFLLFILCVIISYTLGVFFLKFLRKKNYIQPIYEDALEAHKLKAGTPTMGGIVILGTIFITSIITFFLFNFENVAVYFTYWIVILGYGYIGFRDDILKVTKKDNQSGLSPKQKLILQFAISIILILILYLNQWDTNIYLMSYSFDIGALYYLIIPILIVGFSNATNLTDGIDGLLTSVSIISFTALFIIALLLGNIIISWLLLIVVGGLFGFLFFNKNPAKMFMGDTGSLVLGALFAYFCVLLKVELLSILLGLVYILETLSVVVQVSYFKYTKRKFGQGKRVFLVAPYHHHLERKGWNENSIVILATSFQLLIAIVVIWGVI